MHSTAVLRVEVFYACIPKIENENKQVGLAGSAWIRKEYHPANAVFRYSIDVNASDNVEKGDQITALTVPLKRDGPNALLLDEIQKPVLNIRAAPFHARDGEPTLKRKSCNKAR